MIRRHRHVLALLLVVPWLSACGAGGAIGGFFDDASGATPDGGGGSDEAMSEGERVWAGEVFGRVNQIRTAAGLEPLTWHEEASLVAYHHAWDMDVRDFVAHVSPDGDEPGDRLDQQEIPWSLVGENIARGQGDPAAVMDGWMASKGHRANILHPEFTHLGVAVHAGPSDGPFWVQVLVK